MTSNITFEKHKGVLEHKTNNVNFYGLIFLNINEAITYLKNIKPGPYDSWSYNEYVGLYITTEEGFQNFLVNGCWYNEEAFKELMGIQ